MIMAGGLLVSCGDGPSETQCKNNSDCNLESGGTCLAYAPTGNTWCAYPDTVCPSGQRWSDKLTGDGLAGKCVEGLGPDAGTDASVVDAGVADASPDAMPVPDAQPSPDANPTCLPLIAYEHGGAGSRQIWIVKPDGTGATGLTSGGDDTLAQWSPDGQQIAFQRGTTLYAMTASGANIHPVASMGTGNRGFSWSPDSLSLVYSGYQGRSDLFVVSATGGSPTPITADSTEDFIPVWSPDGSKIAWNRAGEIYTAAPDGSGRKLVHSGVGTGKGPNIRWSPDSQSLSFEDNGSIWIVSASGGLPVRPSVNAAPTGAEHGHVWHKSGWIAFRLAADSGAFTGIYRMQKNGSGRAAMELGQGYYPSLSPDGDHVTYEETGSVWVDGTSIVAGAKPQWRRCP